MNHPDREEFERVKKLASESIKASKERAKLRNPPSPESLIETLQEKAARGEAPTEKEMAALMAALSESHIKRGRGRPKGSADAAARRAFFAAWVATDRCNLSAYRNAATGHCMTLCDALAEAMRENGFTSFTTYDAAAAKMKSSRRELREAAANVSHLLKPLTEATAMLRHRLEPLTKALDDVAQRARQTLEAMKIGIADPRFGEDTKDDYNQ